MATLTPTITLTSADATSDALSITATTPLTVTTPSVGLSRQTITVSDDQELVDEAVDATNFVILQTTASVQFARLSPGEFCFFPINTGAGLEARADTASCILEYGYWKKG